MPTKILPAEDIDDFEEEDDDPVLKKVGRVRTRSRILSECGSLKKKWVRKDPPTELTVSPQPPPPQVDNAQSTAVRTEISSYTSAASADSASATLMSSHAMKMGLYSINLGTKMGQKLHAAHMLILPLIPVFILLAQNAQNYITYTIEAGELLTVQQQATTILYTYVMY